MNYFSLWLIFLRNSWKRVLVYRVNFLILIIGNLFWFIFSILFFQILFAQIPAIGGWTLNEVIFLLCVNQIVIGFYDTFIKANLERLPSRIREGSLDFDLVKPVDPIFWLTFQRVQISSMFSLALPAFILVRLLLTHSIVIPNSTAIFLFFLMLFGAVVLRFVVGVLIASLAMRFISVQSLFSLQSEFFQYSGYPTSIYSKGAKLFFTFGIPVIMLANFPAQALLGNKFEPIELSLYPVYIIFGLILAVKVFSHSLRKYSSLGG
ncbi:MAG: ABC-2 family transporter protein [Bellilinea sp.]